MARGTLSFFSRLFSSKKKKILEKRNQENNPSNVHEGISTNEGLQSSATPDSENLNSDFEAGFSQKVHTTETTDSPFNIPSNDEMETGTAPHNAQEVPVQNFDQNMSAGIASATSTLSNTTGVLSVTSEEAEESPETIQEFSNSEEQAASDSTGNDDALEYDSMVLLSKLEQLMIKIGDKSVQKSAPLVIEALVEMTNHAVEFAEQLPISDSKKIPLEMLLNRDEQNYKTLKSEYVKDGRLSIGSSIISESFNDQESYINLSNDILRVINVYLSASVKAFQSSRISEQWKTLYTGFFVNLTKSVRGSQSNQ